VDRWTRFVMPQPLFKELALFMGPQEPLGEPSCMDRGPETVARTCEVMPRGPGVQSGIDAAEQDAKARRDEVFEGAFPCREDLFPGRPGMRRHGSACRAWGATLFFGWR
jgi:hypothetical protein